MATTNLRRRKPVATMAGDSPKGNRLSPRPQKQLTAAEKRTDEGRFAMKLRALLEERGIDRREFAKQVGRTDAAVRTWLRGEAIPGDYSTLKAIGRALDLPGHPFPDYRVKGGDV